MTEGVEHENPSDQALSALYTADTRHIAEMKAAQHSYFKWVIGLGSAFFGLELTREAVLPGLIAAAGLGVSIITAYTGFYIIDCQLSMVAKRKRLWSVYKALRLENFVEKRQEEHTSILYRWYVWLPMVLICGYVAGWCGLSFFRYIWN